MIIGEYRGIEYRITPIATGFRADVHFDQFDVESAEYKRLDSAVASAENTIDNYRDCNRELVDDGWDSRADN